jgi:hypothetical protein
MRESINHPHPFGLLHPDHGRLQHGTVEVRSGGSGNQFLTLVFERIPPAASFLQDDLHAKVPAPSVDVGYFPGRFRFAEAI